MVKEIHYAVVEIELPDHVTGSVTGLETYSHLSMAITELDRLESLDCYKWYDIIVMLIRGD